VEDGLGVLLEDPFDYDTRETVRGILMEDMLSDFDMDETRRTSFCDILFGLLDTKQQQQTNKTITPPKDQQVPVILNNKTKKTKRKQTQKKATPPKTKTKTIYAIKRPIVTVEEVNQYLQHVQNNPDLDEFPMNNLPIRTQIAQCEVEYYKMRNTNPVLAEVDMDFYHSLPPVQAFLGEMTRLESLAMKLAANDNNTTNNTNTTTTAIHTADRP